MPRIAQTQDKFVVRLPDGMRDEIATAAKANGRTMNAEIIARLSGGTETLRDKFAGQAIASFGSSWSDAQTRKTYAKRAYQLADAMLAARKGGEA